LTRPDRTVLVYDVDDLVAHTPEATRVSVRACGDRAEHLVELLTRVPGRMEAMGFSSSARTG
jgi:hypothetical protein